MKNPDTLSNEVIYRYVSGKATMDEIAIVTFAMKKSKELRDLVALLKDMNQAGLLAEGGNVLPVDNLAAVAEGNLCDVLCEQYILRDFVRDQSFGDIPSEAWDNRWLKETGTPLHHMGRLLEKHGMSVVRKYHCTIDELAEFLQKGFRVIAVVDHGLLNGEAPSGFLHAIVCLRVGEGLLQAYDPATEGSHHYPLPLFQKAWEDSKNYLVYASARGMEYIPHPIDVSQVELDEELLDLTEVIAENAHEVWAERRRTDGYIYGEQNNSDPDKGPLTNMDLVPYAELSEKEKDMDRDMALTTIRLVKKLGFNIIRRYTLYCPNCGEFVANSMNYCPNCGQPLPKTD